MSEESDEFAQWMRGQYTAAQAWMDEGYSARRVKGFLMEKGLDEELALRVVADVSAVRHAARRKAAEKSMAIGGVWLAIGSVVVIATHVAAEGGGTCIVACGAILLGGFKFVRGLVQYAGQPDDCASASAATNQSEA